MGRRRQRHFNPATAGCHAVVDARFGMVLTGYPYVSEVAARVGTTYKMVDSLTSLSPQPYNINGQASVKFFESAMALTDGSANAPTFAPGQSIFICSSLDAPSGEYSRVISSTIDAYFACGYILREVPYASGIFSIAGNGTSWFDTDPNVPIIPEYAQNPYAMCVRRDEYTALAPTVNLLVQWQKSDGPSSYTVDTVGRDTLTSGSATPQYWNGDIAMIAIGQTTGVPMDRRILQMMGRVWRIHTL